MFLDHRADVIGVSNSLDLETYRVSQELYRIISLMHARNKFYSTYPIHIKSQQKSTFAKRYCVNATLQRRPQFNVKEGM